MPFHIFPDAASYSHWLTKPGITSIPLFLQALSLMLWKQSPARCVKAAERVQLLSVGTNLVWGWYECHASWCFSVERRAGLISNQIIHFSTVTKHYLQCLCYFRNLTVIITQSGGYPSLISSLLFFKLFNKRNVWTYLWSRHTSLCQPLSAMTPRPWSH